jgi:hypothetical protein
MAITAIQLQGWIDALKAARASGALSVRHGESMVTYRSLSEINSAIAANEQELSLLGGMKTVRAYRITTHKNL